MDNDFRFDEYDFGGDTKAVEPEAIEMLEEAPIMEAPIEEAPVAAPAKKKKLDFKFSPRMLIAPGVAAATVALSGVMDTVSTFATVDYWLRNLIVAFGRVAPVVIGLLLAAGVGYFCYKNISKALKFMGVIFGSWGIGQAAASVVGFVFSIIAQIFASNYDYENCYLVDDVSVVVTNIIAVIFSVAAALLLNLLIEKADAKKAAEEAKQKAEEIVEEKSGKKKLSINIKNSVLIAVAALPEFLITVFFLLIELVTDGYDNYWTIAGGTKLLFTATLSVIVCVVLGFIATKKIDGAVKFLGAYKLASILVVNFTSIANLGMYAIFAVGGGAENFVYVIIDFVIAVPTFILTAALAVALINAFDLGLNFKKKSKKSKIEEAAAEMQEEIIEELAEIKEEFAEEIEDIVEDIEEVVEISAE